MSLISMPMGLLFGAAAGALCMAVACHNKEDHFDDFTYWLNDDGIRTFRNYEKDIGQPIYDPEMGIRPRSNFIKGKRSYL